MKNKSTEIPKLDKPGAGLPLFDQLFLKLVLGPFVSKKSKWDDNRLHLDSLNKKILEIAASMSESALEIKKLVPPQKGLEDSSRFWSIAMTLEHTVIVGNHMKNIITMLSQEKVPDFVVDTAKVKPLGGIPGKEAVVQFKIFSETLTKDLDENVKDRKSLTKLLHPWFGPITAHQWFWLLASHSGIHYKQIKAIKARL